MYASVIKKFKIFFIPKTRILAFIKSYHYYTPMGISFESRLIDLGAISSFHVDNAVFAAGKDGLSICLPRPG